MSNIQEQINKAKSLSSQNAELTYQNSCLIEIAENSNQETSIGKQKLVEAINFGGGNATADMSLFELAEEIRNIVVQSVPLVGASGSIEFEDDTVVRDAIELFNGLESKVKKVVIKGIEYPTSAYSIYCNPRILEFTNLQSVHNSYTAALFGAQGTSRVEELLLPNMLGSSIPSEGGIMVLARYNYKKIRKIYAPKLNQFPQGFGWMTPSDGGLVDLIDFTLGGGATTGTFSLEYCPFINARLESAFLLTDQDVIDGFTTNKEKWLWNLRNHFAALLGETTDGQIIFHADAYAALDEETITAFTSKGWTVASA